MCPHPAISHVANRVWRPPLVDRINYIMIIPNYDNISIMSVHISCMYKHLMEKEDKDFLLSVN